IVGAVRAQNATAIAPDPDEVPRAIAELDEVAAAHPARVAVAPGSDAELRLRNRPGSRIVDSGVIEIADPDHAILADELVALHPEATVLGPPGLVDLVIARLEALVAAHG